MSQQMPSVAANAYNREHSPQRWDVLGIAWSRAELEQYKRPTWQRVTAATFLPFTLGGLLGQGPPEGPGLEAPAVVDEAVLDFVENVARSGAAMADTLTERQRQAREQEKSQRLARTRKVIRPPEPASAGTEPSKGSPVELIRTAYEIVVGDATPPKSSDSDFEFETLGERLAAIEDSTKVRAFIAERWRQYSDAEVEAFVDQGERIIVLLRFYLWLPESEREVSRPEAHVWTVRQGRVLDAFVHPALEVALRDAASANHF